MKYLKQNLLKKLPERTAVFSVGGLGYGLIELLWRGYTHPSMVCAGGVCFLLFYKLCEDEKNMPLLKKCLLGAILITCVELLFGAVVNVWLKKNVWDYSTVPGNFYGQICVPYFFLWFLLCIPLVWLCGVIERWKCLFCAGAKTGR